MLSEHLAKRIVSEVRRLVNEDIIIVDTRGIIIASTDTDRIGNFHEGAYLVCQQKEKRIITKDDVGKLRGVKAGINLPIFFQGDVIGVIGITGDPNEVSPYGELLKKMTELLIQENFYTEQLEIELRAREAFVFDWIQLREWSEDFYGRAQRFGVDFQRPWQVIIGMLCDPDMSLHIDIWKNVLSLWDDKSDLLVRWGYDRFIILRATKQTKNNNEEIVIKLRQLQQALDEKYGIRLAFGIGKSVSAKELHRSYKQAERALRVARKFSGIVFDHDLRLEMFLDDVSAMTKEEFLRRTIEPIRNKTELLDTLRCFFEHNFSIKETARSMHIHINTLHYRLKKIEELTCLSIHRAEDLVTLYLAMLFLDEHTNSQS